MDLTFSYREPTENLTTLADGTPFPAGINLTVIRTGVEPIIELTLEVEVGRPVLARFALRRRGPAGRPLTATEIHNTKVSEIVDAAIRSVAASALVSADAIHDPAAGDQGAGQRASDLARGRRGPTERQLELAAGIAKANRYNPRKEVASQLYVSERTASRWIALAKDHGYDTGEE